MQQKYIALRNVHLLQAHELMTCHRLKVHHAAARMRQNSTALTCNEPLPTCPRLVRDCHQKPGCTTREIQTFVRFYCCLGGLLVKTRPRFDTRGCYFKFTHHVCVVNAKRASQVSWLQVSKQRTRKFNQSPSLLLSESSMW